MKHLDKVAHVLFHVFCLFVTMFLVSNCLRQYLLDEDATRLEYRRFNENFQPNYPSVTYCIGYPVRWGNFWNENHEGDVTEIRNDFLQYISGNDVNRSFTDLDYDKVTIKLEDFLRKITSESSDNTWVIWEIRHGTANFNLTEAYKRYKNENTETIKEDLSSEEIVKIPVPKLYISHRSQNKKCYTIDVPTIDKQTIKQLTLFINPEIVPKFGTKTNYMIKAKDWQTLDLQQISKFSIYFHYPNQYLKALTSKTGFTPDIEETKYYARKYYLSHIEVLRRRQKSSAPCVDGNYDDEIEKSIIAAFDCKPPTIQPGANVSDCKGLDTTKFQNELINNDHPPPCEKIRSISVREGEEDQVWWENWDSDPKLMIEIYFDDEEFRTIQYVKDYTTTSLVGNTGGYIGKKCSQVDQI